MYFVYMLRSISTPNQTYIGYTTDVEARLKVHNKKSSPHTTKFAPWELEAYFGFKEEQTAHAFELYLKTYSGRAFAKKRLLP